MTFQLLSDIHKELAKGKRYISPKAARCGGSRKGWSMNKVLATLAKLGYSLEDLLVARRYIIQDICGMEGN